MTAHSDLVVQSLYQGGAFGICRNRSISIKRLTWCAGPPSRKSAAGSRCRFAAFPRWWAGAGDAGVFRAIGPFPFNLTVLITGDQAGKTRCQGAASSQPRASKAFMLSTLLLRGLLESELFGHEGFVYQRRYCAENRLLTRTGHAFPG
jgi:hypothetical protein